MARHIRVPGIVEVVLVSDPAEIRALNSQAKIDRNFIARGPLINRLIAARIRHWFAIMGQLLPSLLPRGDQVRTDRQKMLAAALDGGRGAKLWTDGQISALASYVRGNSDDNAAGILTQQIVGRLFDPLYRADPATWNAAQVIDQFRNGFSPVQIVWQLTGKLRRARDLLVTRAKDDRWAMHGTAIGVHGIVQALGQMRQLRALPNAGALAEDAVLWRCLTPPKRVPRTVEATLETPQARAAMPAGTIVMFQLAVAGPQAPDAEMVFMRGHWNACPARAFVIELLLAVWRHSLRESVAA
jgi:hypothetical protein